MITENKFLIKDFLKQFNSRLSSLDFVLKASQMKSNYDPFQNQALILPVDDPIIQNQLLDSDYISLIQLIVKNIRIEPECSDVFDSEMDENLMEFYTTFLLKESEKMKVIVNEGRIIILTNDMMADLLWSPISQFHAEIVETFRQFNQYIDALQGHKEALFLNANTSTAFSYFIQIWVAESLGIPLNLNETILVV